MAWALRSWCTAWPTTHWPKSFATSKRPPKAPLFHDCLTVVRKVPKSAGLLPSVRAIEHLRTKGRQPTEQEIDDAVAYHVGDYQRRRALLIA